MILTVCSGLWVLAQCWGGVGWQGAALLFLREDPLMGASPERVLLRKQEPDLLGVTCQANSAKTGDVLWGSRGDRLQGLVLLAQGPLVHPLWQPGSSFCPSLYLGRAPLGW